MTNRAKSWQARIDFWRVVGVLTTLLLVFGLSLWFEEIKQHLPDITTLQLQTYDWLSRFDARAARPQWVIGVEIDNQTFFDCLGLVSDQDVTDRAFLAGLIDRAVEAQAAVIALDINLLTDDQDKSEEARRKQNRALFDAIRRAQASGIPVVLTMGFDYKSMRPQRNIEDGVDTAKDPAQAPATWNCRVQDPSPKPVGKSGPQTIRGPRPAEPVQVSACLLPGAPTLDSDNPAYPAVRAGFDLSPMDKRRVPLLVYGTEPDPQTQQDVDVKCPSFALQVVDAYERAMTIKPTTWENLSPQTRQQYFVYTSFLPEYSHFEAGAEPTSLERFLHGLDLKLGTAESPPQGLLPDSYLFPHVSAADVYNSDPASIKRLKEHIVLIGGHRLARQHGQEWIDYHVGPQGPMVGMYLHANYIEGMLDNRLKLRVGRWTGVFIDCAAAVLIMLAGARARNLAQRLILLAMAFLLVGLLYVAAANLGYCLDVLAVLVILFGHFVWEHYWHLQAHAHAKLKGGAHAR